MLHLNSQGFVFDDQNERKDPVEVLKSLLAAESTSFNSFERCLNDPSASNLHFISAGCRDLHAVNIELIQRRLAEMGFESDENSEFWQSFAGLLNTTASIFGEDAMLGAFRKTEFNLLSEYESQIASFDGDNLTLIQKQLIPNQVRVCELLGAIRSDEAQIAAATPMPPLNLDLA